LRVRWLFPGVLSFFLLAAPTKAGQLQFWRFDSSQNRLEFTTDVGVQPKAQLLANPVRLVIDLPGTVFGRPAFTQSLMGAVRVFRLGQVDRNTARLVLELAPGYTIDPQQVKFQSVIANRWSVQIPQPMAVSATFASQPAEFETSFPEPSVNSGSVPVQIPVPVSPPMSTPPLSLPGRTNARLVVVLDPGHGGPDPGAIGIGGLQEKGVVLDISRQVAALLEQQGIQSILTRSDDRDLELEPRVRLARQNNATLFVSIHANAISMSRPDVNGLETYYFSRGQPLAQTVHRRVLQETGIGDRRVRQARFYVLRNTAMPSILVEVGFLTGRDDAPKLAEAAYRSQTAGAIARGIMQYLQVGTHNKTQATTITPSS
jgi:N-acetylmuramoyl-L-alanine amidase